MKFTVIDNYGNFYTIEANDIHEAIEADYNNHYGYSHIVAVARVDDE